MEHDPYISIDKASIIANPIFNWVMEQEDNCLKLIQAVLPELKIERIYFETQKRLKFSKNKKGIITDILAYDHQNRVYDLEMQLTRNPDLGKRLRYYQSMMDQSVLMAGESYKKLRESYVIVFFPFDPFDEKRRKYTFTTTCQESKRVDLEEKATKIILNSQGIKGKVSQRLQSFFDLMNGKIDTKDKYIRQLQEGVKKYMTNPERRKEYMDYMTKIEDARDYGMNIGKTKGMEIGIKEGRRKGRREGRVEGRKEGIKEGIKEGRKEGKIEGIKQLIISLREDYNISADQIMKTVIKRYGQEYDEAQLKHLLDKTLNSK